MMLSLDYACITSTSLQLISVIRSKTNKYISYADNEENNYITIYWRHCEYSSTCQFIKCTAPENECRDRTLTTSQQRFQIGTDH